MNRKICGTRGARSAVVLAGLAAAALLTTACSSPSTGGGGSASTAETAAYRADIAFAQCVQTHGDPSFPDPVPGSSFQIAPLPVGAAADTTRGKILIACKHLLPTGSTSSNGSVTTQELAEGVTLAQCLRTHGVPSFPDPTVVNGGLNFAFTGVSSPQFLAAVKACRSVTPAGVKLP
ncbi:MAG TPA: hypothetical protein VN969_09370 [Streptosporangiaceae bacterium]|jgi:hypothetical protein|nr:hypothetical protein [Streptosporangiaceae bacterium]